MKRYLLCVLVVFLLETLLLALLQDRPLLAVYMPKQDQALTYAFGLAWPLALVLFFLRRKKKLTAAKSGGKKNFKKPVKRKKKSVAGRTSKSS